MRRIEIVFIAIIFTFVISCEKTETYTISGKAQKGPFTTGTNITINELNNSLGQTGKSFNSQITADDGVFAIHDAGLVSNLILLTANGFYFSELYGELSAAPLTLQAIADVSENPEININILTHISTGRIEHLVSGGLSYAEAKLQAESELLAFLGISDQLNQGFEDLDISQEESSNGVLLSFSLIVQRFTNLLSDKATLTAELTQLMASLREDFRPDGQIDDQSLVDTLLYNVSQLNLIDIRNHIEAKYSNLDSPGLIPDFESYIGKFQEIHKEDLVTTFHYPDQSLTNLFSFGPKEELPNLLAQDKTSYQMGPYSFAAVVPANSDLSIKFISDNSNYSYAIADPQGWEIINEFPDGFTANSQRRNELMSMEIHLEASSTATIEYYENGSEDPVFTKTISW